MKRADRVVWLVVAVCAPACQEPRSPSFDVMEKGIVELSEAMASGAVTSRQLVDAYLERIESYDKEGPRLNAMLSLNPRAREQAQALDREREERGPRGPLHGIPIVLKDNFDTTDMPTTGASIALAGVRPREDAFQVKKLRDAGVVILGKTNMHELAWGITTVSSLGGQTLNPYDPSRNPGGSSGGTGAAVAASFAAFGMGSDTCGSIRYPAAHNNLVGLRSTPGLFSRTGLIPASHTQDLAGPLARTIEDLAIVLDATVGFDAADPITSRGVGVIRGSFSRHLDANALRGARIGVLEPLFGTQPEDEPVALVVRTAIREMEAHGATTILIDMPDLPQLLSGASVPLREFKSEFNEYLERTSTASVRSLTELLDKGLYHAIVDDVLRRANAIDSADQQPSHDAFAQREMARTAILKVMDDHQLSVLAYPSLRRTAARVGERQRGGNCTLSSVTDLPAVTVPAGFVPDDGMPVGVELLGRPFSDGDLLGIAFAYEQVSRHRRPPSSTPSVAISPGPVRFNVRASGTEQVPPVRSDGIAVVELVYHAQTRHLDYTVNITGIDAAEIQAVHLHRAERTGTGPVVLLLSGAEAARTSGSLVLTPPDESALLAGQLYLNIHTSRHPSGELRGQLQPPD